MTSVLTLVILFTPTPRWVVLELIDQGSNHGIRFAGRDQWTASFTGAKSGIQTRGNTCEEPAVFSFGFSCRAGQSAENAGTAYANPGKPLKRGIAGDQRLVQGIIVRQVKQHSLLLPNWAAWRRRKSGVYFFSRTDVIKLPRIKKARAAIGQPGLFAF